MNLKQILVIAIIAMFLIVPFASAKQESVDVVKDSKIDKKTDERVINKTKESAKEISTKDAGIKGKITVTDSDTSKYSVEKKFKTEIRITKREDDGQHTKAKVSMSRTDLEIIDIDKDGKFGVIRKSDSGEILDIYTATTAQLLSGIEMTFTTNIVNGCAGAYTKVGASQTASSGLSLGQSFASNQTSAVTLNISTTAYNDPYSEIAAMNSLMWLKCDEGSGTKLIDASGNGNNLTNTETATYRTGKHNGAVYWPSTTFATGTALANVGIGNSFTFSIFFNSTDCNTASRLFSTAQNSSNRFAVSISAMTLRAGFYDGTSYIGSVSSAPLQNNTRYHATIVSNNGTLTMYINNVVQSGTSSPSGAVASGLNLGRQYTSIDDVVVLPVAATEVQRSLLAYDCIQQLQACTNVNSTYTGYWNNTSDNPLSIPVSASDGLISSIIFKVPPTITQNGVTIYQYNATAAFAPICTVYFTEDVTLVSETAGDVFFNVSISHTTTNTATSGTIEYPLNSGHAYNGEPVLASTNPNATATNNGTYLIISTGYVPSGQTYTYNVSISQMEGLYLGFLQSWNGLLQKWGFVSDSPTLADRDTYIGDEIEVTVS